MAIFLLKSPTDSLRRSLWLKCTAASGTTTTRERHLLSNLASNNCTSLTRDLTGVSTSSRPVTCRGDLVVHVNTQSIKMISKLPFWLIIFFHISRISVPHECTSKMSEAAYSRLRKNGQRTYEECFRQILLLRQFFELLHFCSDTIILWSECSFDRIVPGFDNFANMPCHKTYTNWEKLRLLDALEESLDGGEALRSCCRALEVQPSQIRRWMKAKHALANPEAAHRNSLHAGRAFILAPLENQWMRWFLKLH